MLRALTLLIALAAAWLLWSGLYKPLIIVFGAISCGLALWIAKRMGTIQRETVPIQLGLAILTYWLWLLKEIAKSNIAVVKAILARDGAKGAGFLDFEAGSSSELAQVILGNSITLTPGTVTCDIHRGRFIVHALDRAEGEAGCAVMNRRASALEPEGGHARTDKPTRRETG